MKQTIYYFLQLVWLTSVTLFLGACGGDSKSSSPELSLDIFPINVASDLSEDDKRLALTDASRLIDFSVSAEVKEIAEEK